MARGRHARPTAGLLSWLWSWLLLRPVARRRAEAERERALLRELHAEVQQLRVLGEQHAAEAALSGVRARRAEEQALAAWKEAHALRTEVVRLREQLREAQVEARLAAAAVEIATGATSPAAATAADGESARVIDLRPAVSS